MFSKQKYPITKPEAVLLNIALGGSILHNQAEFNDAIINYIQTALGSLEGALKYSGVVPSSEWDAAVSNHVVGQVFVVKQAGTYVGQSCEVGDFIICNTTSDYEENNHWDVVQTNIDGAIVSQTPKTTHGNIVVFQNTTGSVVSDSGVNIDSISKLETTTNTLSTSVEQIQNTVDHLKSSVNNNTLQIETLGDAITDTQDQLSVIDTQVENLNSVVDTKASVDDLNEVEERLREEINSVGESINISVSDGLQMTDSGSISVALSNETNSENFLDFENTDNGKTLAVRSIKTNATKLSKSITVAGINGTLGTGYYKNGVTIEAGTDIETILNNLLTSEIYPTTSKNTPSMSVSIAAPTITASVTSGSTVEVGTKITISDITTKTSTYSSIASKVSGFTYGYSSTDDDSADSTETSISKNWSITKTSDSYTVTAVFTGFGNQNSITNTATVEASISIPELTVGDGTNKIQLSYSGATFAGTVAEIPEYYIVSNLGNTDALKMSVKAPTVTDTKTPSGSATYTVTGTRYAFYGSSSTAIENTSTGIRGLAQHGTSKSFSVTVDDGSNYVIIAFPSTWGSLTSVADTGAFGTDIVASFGDAVEVNVEGANNYSAITYKVYTYSPDAALGQNKYNVVIS